MADIKCNNCGFTTFEDEFGKNESAKCLSCGQLVWKNNSDDNIDVMMECGKCQKQISKNAPECPKCGWQRTIPCNVCGEKIPYTSISCPECGDPRPFKKLVSTSKSSSANPTKRSQSSKDEYVVNFHPWRRYFAKFIDMSTIGFAFFWMIIFIFAKSFPEIYLKNIEIFSNQIIAGILLTIFWVFVDAVLLAIFGTSIGRWIFGISVLSNAGETLEFDQSFKRSVLVAIQGLGMSIPLVGFFTQIFAYRRLIKTGSTLWDNSAGSVVLHNDLSGTRIFFCAIAIIANIIWVGIIINLGKAI